MEYDEVIFFPDSLSTSVSPRFFNNSVIFFGMFFLILGFMLLLWTLIYAKSKTILDPSENYKNLPKIVKSGVIQRKDNDGTPGTANDEDGRVFYSENGSGIDNIFECNEEPTRAWSDNKCRCHAPFWGKNCELESYGREYYAVGNYPIEDDGKIKLVNRKSFKFLGIDKYSQTTCEDYCNKDNNCIGFQYENVDPKYGLNTLKPLNNCKLLYNPPEGIPQNYEPFGENNTYLLRNKNPQFKNFAWLYKGSLGRRFWLDEGTDTEDIKILKLPINKVNKINWTPSGVINDGKHFLIVSNKHFIAQKGLEMINIKNLPKGWYVSKGGDYFNPPNDIIATNKSFWIMVANPKIKFKDVKVIFNNKEIIDFNKKQKEIIDFNKKQKEIINEDLNYDERTPSRLEDSCNDIHFDDSADSKTLTDLSVELNSEWN